MDNGSKVYKRIASFSCAFSRTMSKASDAMSRGREYRQLLVNIGKVSSTRKMRKPHTRAMVCGLLLSSLAVLLLLALMIGLASL